MMSFAIHVFIMLSGVFIASLAQLLLKKSALVEYRTYIRQYVNMRVIAAYILFFISTICALIGYRVVPISLGMLLDSTGYIYITIFGIFIFNEKATINRLAGLAFIIFGILVYALAG